MQQSSFGPATVMLQKNVLISIILACFLWTSTFLHDIEEIGLSLAWTDGQHSAVHGVHHVHGYGHSHARGHTHFGHNHGSASKDVATVSDIEHAHDPLLLGSGRQNASTNVKASFVKSLTFNNVCVVANGATVDEACRSRPPPVSTYKAPIYILKRAILI